MYAIWRENHHVQTRESDTHPSKEEETQGRKGVCVLRIPDWKEMIIRYSPLVPTSGAFQPLLLTPVSSTLICLLHSQPAHLVGSVSAQNVGKALSIAAYSCPAQLRSLAAFTARTAFAQCCSPQNLTPTLLSIATYSDLVRSYSYAVCLVCRACRHCARENANTIITVSWS